MNIRFFLKILLLIWVVYIIPQMALVGQNSCTNSPYILKQSSRNLDPNDDLKHRNIQLHIQEPRVGNPHRFSTVDFGPGSEYFKLIRGRQGYNSIHATYPSDSASVDFSNIIDDNFDRNNPRLNPENNFGYRRFYQTLYNLPASLLDQINNIQDAVPAIIGNKNCYAIQLELKEPLIKKDWKIYIDQNSYELLAVDLIPSAKDKHGERITFRDKVKIQDITIPRNRTWYDLHSLEYLGSDIVMRAEKSYFESNEKLNIYLHEHQRLFSGNILVQVGDKEVYFNSIDPINSVNELTRSSKFRMGSLTKQFVAAIILKLQEENLLNLEDPVRKHLNVYKRYPEITIKTLLNHTSGIPNYIFFNDYEDFQDDIHSHDQMVDRFKDLPLEFTPGTQFNYTNSGYYLLGLIIEKTTGKPFGNVLEEYITQPFELTSTGLGLDIATPGYDQEHDDIRLARGIDISVPFTAGGMYSTIADLAKWNKVLFGEEFISRVSLDEMTTPGLDDYGLGLWIEGSRVWHTGGINGFRSIMSYDHKSGLMIILLSNIHQTPVIEIEVKIQDLFSSDG